MYVCIYIYVYMPIYMYVCMYIYIYVCMLKASLHTLDQNRSKLDLKMAVS